jgi:EpsD family peptidyl-prolyl cis-trans isomerase
MKRWVGIALAVTGCVALVACNGAKKAPTGQVVATVGDKEITIRDLRAEMGANNAQDPKALKAAETAALRNVIGRDILADEARKEGLDKTPDFALQRQRLLDSLLVETLQRKVAAQVPQATREEAQQFVNSHPDMFAQRKVFVLDQLQMPRPNDPAIVKALEPLKTFDQIQALLTQDKIPFKRDTAALDALQADPRLVAAVLKLPPGELFVLPANGVLTVNQIKDTKIVPFTGDPAVSFAQQFITRQRTQEAVQRRFQSLFAAKKNTVTFSKEFEPPKPPATASSPAAPASGGSPAPAAAPASGG